MTFKYNPKYKWAWILWVLAFGIIEWRAIVDPNKGGTLSHTVRNLLGEKGAVDAGNWAFRAGLTGFFVWIIPHLYRYVF